MSEGTISAHGQDIEGTKFERIVIGSAFGYREMWLVYEPHAKFTEADEEFLIATARNLIASARSREGGLA